MRRLKKEVGKFWGTNSNFISVLIGNRQTNPTQGCPPTATIEHFDNPFAPVVLEQSPAPFLPEGFIIVPGQVSVKPEGYLTYNASTQSADLFWSSNSNNNQKAAQAVEYTYQQLNQANGTILAALPNFSATYHPLGGATLDSVCSTYGEVKGYSNLFVVDGSLIPGSTACANPSLTIAALAERCMDRFVEKLPKKGRS